LYTSGSTGKPKGVLHTTAGYLLGVSYTHRLVFDLRDEDTYWCTADIGWVTGHSYTIYGPLANGATTLMYEGAPNHPREDRFWEIVDKQGRPLPANQGGLLVIQKPWPAMLRTIYGDDDRYREQYWSNVPHAYFTADGARQDQDGYFWIMGRVDDVLNVAGHRLSTM